jgi:hypothetical protein
MSRKVGLGRDRCGTAQSGWRFVHVSPMEMAANTITGTRNRSWPTLIDDTEKSATAPASASTNRYSRNLISLWNARAVSTTSTAFSSDHASGMKVARLKPAPSASPSSADTSPEGR